MRIKKDCALALAILIFSDSLIAAEITYPVVGTGTTNFWGNSTTIAEPQLGDSFYGQEPQYDHPQPSYIDNGDGTISDNVTGLMWTQTADLNGDGTINVDDKISFSAAPDVAASLSVGGYDDWRVPTIKEIYSLMNFRGLDPSGWNGTDVSLLTPFIDDTYFDVGFGDTEAGERIIDGQYVTTTKYVSTTMNGDETMFGLNLVDGRIKGYGLADPVTHADKGFYAYFVRGSEEYGINKFAENGNGTITDSATGLMWSQDDSKEGMTWEEAFAWIVTQNSESFLGYSDWRLPTIKELQSILDYSRSPKTDGTAAIDPLFNCNEITVEDGQTQDFPFYWSSTTHENMKSGENAAYMCFGTAYGWMSQDNVNYTFMDVHGAGAQRSDPKNGNPNDFPYGHGPQGDVIRVLNYVRPVRTITSQEQVAVVPYSVVKGNVEVNLSNGITVTVSGISDYVVTLATPSGRVISSTSANNGVAHIQGVSQHASGVYFLAVQSTSFKDVQRIILQ